MAESFVTERAFDASHPPALAVYCSDGRFTASVEELLRGLGHPRLDTLTIPGGPGLLNHRTSGYTDCDTCTRAAEFLIREHHITVVVLLAHAGCGYYARKYPDLTLDQIRERQIGDLRHAWTELSDAHPRLSIQAYLAVPEAGRVRFDSVDR
jgi:carbonic anhydrase